MTRQWRVVWSSLYSPVPALMSRTWLAGIGMHTADTHGFYAEFMCIMVLIIFQRFLKYIEGRTYTHTHTHTLKPWCLIPLGLQRSTVHPRVVVMVLGWSRCWRSCPPHSSVMCTSRPGTSLTVEAPLGTGEPWGQPPLRWLSLIWLMLKGWAVGILWAKTIFLVTCMLKLCTLDELPCLKCVCAGFRSFSCTSFSHCILRSLNRF